jgi:hypothetical protein
LLHLQNKCKKGLRAENIALSDLLKCTLEVLNLFGYNTSLLAIYKCTIKNYGNYVQVKVKMSEFSPLLLLSLMMGKVDTYCKFQVRWWWHNSQVKEYSGILKLEKKRLPFNKITFHSSCRQLIMKEKCKCSMANGFIFKELKADKKNPRCRLSLGSDFIHQGPIFLGLMG